MSYIAIFTAVIAVLSLLPPIPMPFGMPMTLQTFAVPLAGVVLGAKRGVFAVIAYVLLGAIGLPVFAGFTSGFGVLFGFTGGFLFGFPFYAFFAGWGANRGGLIWLLIGLFIGMVVTYSLGLLQFSLVTGHSLQVSFLAVVWQFLPAEFVKLLLVVLLGPPLRRRLEAGGVL